MAASFQVHDENRRLREHREPQRRMRYYHSRHHDREASNLVVYPCPLESVPRLSGCYIRPNNKAFVDERNRNTIKRSSSCITNSIQVPVPQSHRIHRAEIYVFPFIRRTGATKYQTIQAASKKDSLEAMAVAEILVVFARKARVHRQLPTST